MSFSEYIKYILLLIFFPRSLKTMEWRMLKLLNKDRKLHNLRKLKMQDDLREVARKHSKDMAEKDYFDHINLQKQSSKDRLQLKRVTEYYAGENLAKIRGFLNPTQKAEEGLMNSPGHRANILNKNYNCIGIGIIKSLQKVYYFTQNFAKRNLIFKKSIPKKVKIKKGLKIKGFSITPLPHILLLLKQFNHIKIKKIIELKQNNFDFLINFPSHGEYDIEFYVPEKNKLSLANHFKIYVKKGIFW